MSATIIANGRPGVNSKMARLGSRPVRALSAVLHPADFSGLKTFRQDYPEARLVLLYRGETQFLRDGILAVPVESFLRSLVPGRPPLAAFFPE